MKAVNRRGIGRILPVLLLFIISFLLIIYPFLANFIFENRTDSLVRLVEETAQEINDETRVKELELAEKYNEMIQAGHIQLQDPFVSKQTNDFADNYDSLLCMTEDGVMGFVKIPSIQVSLPIYHGTSEQTLEMGLGHLQGTSLPIGGSGTHCVITGHTGLSNTKMFTDLVELEEGDIFILVVFGERLVYQVDQIKTVKPDQLEDLAVVPEKDYCTLLTCTPYGVNTHRLLVRGIRTEEEAVLQNEDLFRAKKVESRWLQEYKRDILVSVSMELLALIIYVGMKMHKRKRSMKIKGGVSR